MKRRRSTGNPTIAQRQRMDAIAERGDIMLDCVRAEFWDMAVQNRRAA